MLIAKAKSHAPNPHKRAAQDSPRGHETSRIFTMPET